MTAYLYQFSEIDHENLAKCSQRYWHGANKLLKQYLCRKGRYKIWSGWLLCEGVCGARMRIWWPTSFNFWNQTMKFQPSVVDDAAKMIPQYWSLKSLGGGGEIEFEVNSPNLIIVGSANYYIVFVQYVLRYLRFHSEVKKKLEWEKNSWTENCYFLFHIMHSIKKKYLHA